MQNYCHKCQEIFSPQYLKNFSKNESFATDGIDQENCQDEKWENNSYMSWLGRKGSSFPLEHAFWGSSWKLDKELQNL